MSAEADRRLQEDLRFLESVNVWHLVNLRSPNPHAIYPSNTYSDTLDVISPSMAQLGAYSHNSYNQLSPNYLDGHKYFSLSAPSGGNGGNLLRNSEASAPPISAGIGTSLPYPDLILHAHAKEIIPRSPSHRTTEKSNINVKPYEELESLPKSSNIVESRDFSPVIQNSLPLKETPRLKHLTLLPKEPEDYDAEESLQDGSTPDGKKSVTFTADTVFVERDMDSPFWLAFSERRRLRRIHKQRKQMSTQTANSTYQPSLLEIVKSAFSKSPTKDNNGNTAKRKSRHHHSKKGEVLVYDNSSQIPETYTAQYVYSVPPSKSQKLFQIFTCQCCSPDPTSS